MASIKWPSIESVVQREIRSCALESGIHATAFYQIGVSNLRPSIEPPMNSLALITQADHHATTNKTFSSRVYPFGDGMYGHGHHVNY